MIYFSLREILLSVIAFLSLGLLSAFLYFFLSFLKKEGKINFLKLKRLFLTSPKNYKPILSEDLYVAESPNGHFFEFLFTLLVGLAFILFSYVFTDGLFRLVNLLIFALGYCFMTIILSRHDEPVVRFFASAVSIFLYIFALLIYPVRRLLEVILRTLFLSLRHIILSIYHFFRKMLIKSHFSNN